MGKPTGFMDYKREDAAAFSVEERIKNFNEFHTPLSKEEQQKQGARCMDCGVPFCQSGKVLLNGMEWSAVSKQPEDILPVDTEVVVVRVEGAHLVVKKAQEEENHSA